mgnify:CR=1 FL=1
MSTEDLIALNPALNRPMISGPHTQVLVLPADSVDTFKRNLAAHDRPLTSWQPYTLKSGDSLQKLAAKHGIALAKLKLANGITPRTKVGPGFQVLLPVKGSDAAAEPLPDAHSDRLACIDMQRLLRLRTSTNLSSHEQTRCGSGKLVDGERGQSKCTESARDRERDRYRGHTAGGLSRQRDCG